MAQFFRDERNEDRSMWRQEEERAGRDDGRRYRERDDAPDAERTSWSPGWRTRFGREEIPGRTRPLEDMRQPYRGDPSRGAWVGPRTYEGRHAPSDEGENGRFEQGREPGRWESRWDSRWEQGRPGGFSGNEDPRYGAYGPHASSYGMGPGGAFGAWEREPGGHQGNVPWEGFGREPAGSGGATFGGGARRFSDVASGDFGERRSLRGRGPKGYVRSDERIKEEVCDILTDDPRIDASEIEVQVRSGEVLLTGHVSSRQEKRLIEDVLDEISGVKEVNNQLRVQRQDFDERTNRPSASPTRAANTATSPSTANGGQPSTPVR